jgi:hypothetical protein
MKNDTFNRAIAGFVKRPVYLPKAGGGAGIVKDAGAVNESCREQLML